MDTAPWGGSEELWSKTALCLANRGVRVSASVHGWEKRHPKVEELVAAGIAIHERKSLWPSFWERMLRRLRLRGHRDLAEDTFRDWLVNDQPDLVVFNDGRVASRPDWGRVCQQHALRYVNFCQSNAIVFWPDDNFAQQQFLFLDRAVVQFFLSEHNVKLCEEQLGYSLKKAEVMCNPFDVDYDAQPSWPEINKNELNIACVGRLEPISKGQDILFKILCKPHWRERDVVLNLYGAGNTEQSLRKMAANLGIQDKIIFQGFTSDIESIWKNNHAMVLPSRHEGQPIVTVEAMLCHRIAITTDVGRNPDLIEDGVDGYLAEAGSLASFENVMERAWQNRARFQEMGLKAGIKIRQMIPRCPEQVFAERLLQIASA